MVVTDVTLSWIRENQYTCTEQVKQTDVTDSGLAPHLQNEDEETERAIYLPVTTNPRHMSHISNSATSETHQNTPTAPRVRKMRYFWFRFVYL